MKKYFNYNKYARWCRENKYQNLWAKPEMHGLEVTDGYIEEQIGLFTIKYFLTDTWTSKRKLKPII